MLIGEADTEPLIDIEDAEDPLCATVEEILRTLVGDAVNTTDSELLTDGHPDELEVTKDVTVAPAVTVKERIDETDALLLEL